MILLLLIGTKYNFIMNVLILGGNGFIGRNIIKKAIKLNWKIYSLNKNKSYHNIHNIIDLTIDVNNYEDVKNKISNLKFEYVINCLGYVNHSSFSKDGYDVIQNHFIGILNIIKCLNRSSLKKFINIGTSDEYDFNLEPKNEEMHILPRTCYSFSKYTISNFLKMLHITEKFPSITLRLFLAYGPGQNKERFIPQIILGCISNSEFSVSKGDQIRDFCHIDDVVNAIILSLESTINNGEIYNIGSGNPIKIKNLVDKIVKKITFGKPIFGALPYKEFEHMNLYADVKKAEIDLKWSSKISIDDGLEDTINFYKLNNII
jgi:nucleoside-diphosphate-sugar epimerase